MILQSVRYHWNVHYAISTRVLSTGGGGGGGAGGGKIPPQTLQLPPQNFWQLIQ